MAYVTGDVDHSLDSITGDIDACPTNRFTCNLATQPMADLTNAIERMVEIEASLGVRLSALSAMTDEDGDLSVLGEVHFDAPPKEDNSIEVHLLVYDTQGRVVGKQYSYVGSEGIPFDSFDLAAYDLPDAISKIRVYVKRG
jgi:hypothetical protein